MRRKMETLNEPALAFVDFNGGHAEMISRDDVGGSDLLPTILDALSRDFGNQSVVLPGHEEFSLKCGVTDGSLVLGVFRGTRPTAVIHVGDGLGAQGAWETMDEMCHRVFGSPQKRLRMPEGPWVVLVEFRSLASPQPCDWVGELARAVGLAWVIRQPIGTSPITNSFH